jgi:hypothetical protein
MKNNKTLVLLFLILTATALFFYFNQNFSTVKKELSDFAVKDTAAITKIFLADRNGNTVLLERKNKSQWILNNQDEPKPEFLRLFLNTIYHLEVKSKVAKAAYNNVLKALASTGIKCEIYFEGKETPGKVYYVGGQTSDAQGTFMMLEGSSMPFIVEIPGHMGYLTPRYNTTSEAWKNPVLFRVPLPDIKSVSVSYLNYPEKSFTITSNKSSYYIDNQESKESVKAPDSVSIINYLALFGQVSYETTAKDPKAGYVDSLTQTPPSIIIRLTQQNGKQQELDLYPMPVNEHSLTRVDSLGKPLRYDLDRVYGFRKPEKQLVVVQHVAFDRLLRQYQDFIPTPAKSR